MSRRTCWRCCPGRYSVGLVSLSSPASRRWHHHRRLAAPAGSAGQRREPKRSRTERAQDGTAEGWTRYVLTGAGARGTARRNSCLGAHRLLPSLTPSRLSFPSLLIPAVQLADWRGRRGWGGIQRDPAQISAPAVARAGSHERHFKRFVQCTACKQRGNSLGRMALTSCNQKERAPGD